MLVAPVGAVDSISQSGGAGTPLSALMRGALTIWIANPPSAAEHDTDGQKDMLWTRLHQLIPRRKRNS